MLLGTPDYIAPEVLKHAEKVYQEEEEDEEEQDRSAFGASSMSKKEEVDQEERAYGAEVDWWACGIVLYEVRGEPLTPPGSRSLALLPDAAPLWLHAFLCRGDQRDLRAYRALAGAGAYS